MERRFISPISSLNEKSSRKKLNKYKPPKEANSNAVLVLFTLILRLFSKVYEADIREDPRDSLAIIT
jgi:hypothetical protein